MLPGLSTLTSFGSSLFLSTSYYSENRPEPYFEHEKELKSWCKEALSFFYPCFRLQKFLCGFWEPPVNGESGMTFGLMRTSHLMFWLKFISLAMELAPHVFKRLAAGTVSVNSEEM